MNTDTKDKAMTGQRDETQRVVIEWGERCFGTEHMRDKVVRAARFIEEAAELVQSCGLPIEHARRAIDYVYSRPAGDPAQELGGVSNTQYALAGALGLSVASCEAKEIARCLAKSPEHFAARNRNKIEKVDTASPPAPQGGEIERLRAENERLQTDFVAMAGHYNSQVMKNERLGSAQAPARTYADGIEDAAKVADEHVQLLIGHANCDPSGDAMSMAESIRDAIRALSPKPTTQGEKG